MTTVDDQRCATCGAALDAGAVFCGACGARVGAPAATPGDGTAATAAPGAGLPGDGTAAAPATPVPAAPGTGAPATSVPVTTDRWGGGPVDPWGAAPAAATPATRVAAPAPAARAVPVPAAEPTPGWSLGADVDDAVAPVWRRLVALLVDQVLAALVAGAGALVVLPTLRSEDATPAALLVPALLLLLLAAGQWFAEAFAGRTLGGALLGTRTVSARTGRPAGLWAILVRSVVQALGGVLAGIGVYVVAGSGAWDEGPERRGWHDKAAGTLVLRARPPRQPETAPVAATPAPRPAPTPTPPRPTPTTGPPPARPAEQPATPEGTRTAPEPGTPPVAGESTTPHDPRAATPAATGVHEDRGATPASDEAPAPAPAPLAPAAPAAPPATSAAPPPPLAGESVTPHDPRVALPATPGAHEVRGETPGDTAGGGLPDSTVPTVPVLGDLEHTRVAGWGTREDVGPVVLALASGERVAVTGPGLIGRRPHAEGGPWSHVLAVVDPEQSVSSTHLAFRPVPGGLEVVDRGSTNGTVLVDPDGKPWTLVPAQPAHVTAGWTLVLGTYRIPLAEA